MTAQLPPVGFIGVGAAGSALARAFVRAGVPVTAIYSRRRVSAEALARELPDTTVVDSAQAVVDQAELVFLTVPDDEIATVCAGIVWRPAKVAIHCSGALPLDPLDPARQGGASVGSFHPLQTFAGAAQDADLIAGSAIGIEADPAIEPLLERLARRVGGLPVSLHAADKALYHLAAVFASNYVVTLMATATDLYAAFGVSRERALPLLLPLLHGVVANLEGRGLPGALTGPIARGDMATVERHLEALAAWRPDLLPLYRALAERTLPLAAEKLLGAGGDPGRLESVRRLLRATGSPLDTGR